MALLNRNHAWRACANMSLLLSPQNSHKSYHGMDTHLPAAKAALFTAPSSAGVSLENWLIATTCDRKKVGACHSGH